jgi:hypothetical protein
MGSAY